MKVGEYIKLLEKFDKDLEIGGRGYFGEILELDIPYHSKCDEDFVVVSHEDAGDEPD